jgi:hypothetical protein
VYEQLVKGIEDVLRRFHGRYVLMDDIRYLLGELGCEYWVDEHPELYDKIYIFSLGLRLNTENAYDLLWCTVEGEEVEVPISMWRAVVELPNGTRYIFIHSYEVKTPRKRE